MSYLQCWQNLPGVCSQTQNSAMFELGKIFRIAYRTIESVTISLHRDAPDGENRTERKAREKENAKNELLRTISGNFASKDSVKPPQSTLETFFYVNIWGIEDGEWALKEIQAVKAHIAQLVLSVWPAVAEAVRHHHADLIANRLPGDTCSKSSVTAARLQSSPIHWSMQSSTGKR